jgi:hypothetical protein
VIAALVLASLAGLLAVTLPLTLLRRPRRSYEPRPSRPATQQPTPPSPTPPPPSLINPGPYPESLTAELDPGDEEYLAFLANELWPEDEYLDMEPTIDHDNEADGGGGMCR